MLDGRKGDVIKEDGKLPLVRLPPTCQGDLLFFMIKLNKILALFLLSFSTCKLLILKSVLS